MPSERIKSDETEMSADLRQGEIMRTLPVRTLNPRNLRHPDPNWSLNGLMEAWGDSEVHLGLWFDALRLAYGGLILSTKAFRDLMLVFMAARSRDIIEHIAEWADARGTMLQILRRSLLVWGRSTEKEKWALLEDIHKSFLAPTFPKRSFTLRKYNALAPHFLRSPSLPGYSILFANPDAGISLEKFLTDLMDSQIHTDWERLGMAVCACAAAGADDVLDAHEYADLAYDGVNFPRLPQEVRLVIDNLPKNPDILECLMSLATNAARWPRDSHNETLNRWRGIRRGGGSLGAPPDGELVPKEEEFKYERQ
jgi:hypothetical protein